MKNCAGCDNILSDEATFCNVCHTRVGELKPRPGFEPSKYSEYTGLIIVAVVIFVLALALVLTVFVDDDTTQVISYIVGGITIISAIISAILKVTGGKK